MTTQQALDYEQKVIDSAKEWVFGNASIDNQIELSIIATHYKVKLSACCYHFQYSNNPNDLCCTGAIKSLYKVLDKLKNAIMEAEYLDLPQF